MSEYDRRIKRAPKLPELVEDHEYKKDTYVPKRSITKISTGSLPLQLASHAIPTPAEDKLVIADLTARMTRAHGSVGRIGVGHAGEHQPSDVVSAEALPLQISCQRVPEDHLLPEHTQVAPPMDLIAELQRPQLPQGE